MPDLFVRIFAYFLDLFSPNILDFVHSSHRYGLAELRQDLELETNFSEESETTSASVRHASELPFSSGFISNFPFGFSFSGGVSSIFFRIRFYLN